MSVEKAKQFLKEYRSNEEAVKILEQAPQPKSEDEAIARLVETAGKLGTRITEEDMAKAVRELKEEQKIRTDAAAGSLEILEDDELEDVSGGVYMLADDSSKTNGKRLYGCQIDFTTEDCALRDACYVTANVYYGCEGGKKYFAKGDEYDCFMIQWWCKENYIF